MRILKQDFRQGNVKVQVEDLDDLWYLSGIIEPGDSLRGSTERKIKLGGSEEKTKVIKRRVILTIRAEKVDYSGSDLRIFGPIIDGPDDMPRGSGHSFTLVPGDEISIGKLAWPGYVQERLEESTKKRGAVLVALYDREHAIILNVTGRSVQELLSLKGDVAKKGLDDQKQGTFYKELSTQLQELVTRHNPRGLVLASPAFWQEYLKRQLPRELAKRAVFTTVSDVERTAVKELLTRPEVQSLLADTRSTQELGYVEETMQALAHDRLAYGEKDVAAAVDEGNIKAVFITEPHIQNLREKGSFAPVERLLKAVESLNASVHIISTDEAADKLAGLGGIVAIRRW